MNLWIRSQDKTRLSKIIDVYVVGYDDDWAIGGYCVNGCDDFDLGVYSTKERALEVLDEIQEYMTIDECNYENNSKTCYQDCKCYKSNVIMIYEMPKE